MVNRNIKKMINSTETWTLEAVCNTLVTTYCSKLLCVCRSVVD